MVELRNDIRTSRFLTVLSDGSSDSGVLDQEIVYVRFVNDGLPQTKFVDIEHLYKADANSILSAIGSACERLFLSDFKPKNKNEIEY